MGMVNTYGGAANEINLRILGTDDRFTHVQRIKAREGLAASRADVRLRASGMQRLMPSTQAISVSTAQKSKPKKVQRTCNHVGVRILYYIQANRTRTAARQCANEDDL